jgi:dolichyl-phosphate beta-glucosyltransferase
LTLTDPFLSIIFPAHNEEIRLPAALDKTIAFLNRQSYTAEIVVVENGSSDRTLEIARSYQSNYSNLIVIHEDGSGKGLAVRRGMLEAHGDYRITCDVDLSMPIEQVSRFIPPQNQADIVIASREAAGAVRYNEPELRHLIGRAFNSVVRILAIPSIQDTQCGFKCFSRKAALELFPGQTIDGWTFDVEVLFIAIKHGYKITEIGIPWYYDANSKVKVAKDLSQVVKDLIRIRWNGLRGRYDPD